MKITIITLFPDMIRPFMNESIVKRAQEKGIVEIEIVNLRDFAIDAYGSVDDRPYGGGAGMVMRIEPLVQAIRNVQSKIWGNKVANSRRVSSTNINTLQQISCLSVLTTPRGEVFNQQKAKQYSKLDHLILIAGHYEGIDERFSDYIDEEISIGDFVMTGGEIAVCAIVDSVVRLIPGSLKKREATEEESFMEVDIDEIIVAVGENEVLHTMKKEGKKKIKVLEYPQYTRPEEFEGKKVPKILLSGDPKKIRLWRLLHAFKTTLKRRPSILDE